MRNPSVGMKSPFEFERAPDGGETEVSSYFGLCPSQLTPLTWRTLMAIQVLGEFHGFSVGVNEILYSYYFAPLVNKARFYHLRSRDGAPLVEEPSRGIRGNYPFGDGWNNRCISSDILCWRSSSEAYNGSSPAIPMGDFSGNVVRLSVSAVYDEHHKAKTRKMRPFYTPRQDCQVNDMMACRDLLVQLVRASSRWELMRERLEKLVEHWILKKSIADIYSCPGGSTSSRGVFPGSPPRILLWDPRQDTGLWVPAKRNPGSPLWSSPGPVPRPPPSPGERKTSDKENLPYFRIWKSLTYSNRLRPALRRLYKGNLNPRARDRHFET
ncbi:hypothetical protein F2Q70_00022305 [Brassica cretica]|uniref:Uncharacterized protein n=1 Tax=Brassica cretica TaxID=69181 RepID=A0A8S9GMQ6_BRACR|nr:hypothetical protein F2Q70_00022305 [Brassica cretica]